MLHRRIAPNDTVGRARRGARESLPAAARRKGGFLQLHRGVGNAKTALPLLSAPFRGDRFESGGLDRHRPERFVIRCQGIRTVGCLACPGQSAVPKRLNTAVSTGSTQRLPCSHAYAKHLGVPPMGGWAQRGKLTARPFTRPAAGLYQVDLLLACRLWGESAQNDTVVRNE